VGERNQKVQQLRSVSCHYKQLPQGPQQYGLIAEEVVQVYPELLTRGARGEVESVRYEELIPLLLNEHQHRQLQTMSQQLGELKQQSVTLQTAMKQLHGQVSRAIAA